MAAGGWLKKRGAILKAQKLRYFVLEGHSANYYGSYSEAQGPTQLKGSLPLYANSDVTHKDTFVYVVRRVELSSCRWSFFLTRRCTEKPEPPLGARATHGQRRGRVGAGIYCAQANGVTT